MVLTASETFPRRQGIVRERSPICDWESNFFGGDCDRQDWIGSSTRSAQTRIGYQIVQIYIGWIYKPKNKIRHIRQTRFLIRANLGFHRLF
jgi:hypothetical protein